MQAITKGTILLSTEMRYLQRRAPLRRTEGGIQAISRCTRQTFVGYEAIHSCMSLPTNLTSMSSPFVRRFGHSLRQRKLLPHGSNVVVAVSGGPDSVCLLHLLLLLRAPWNLRLTVAHFHHGLRGAAADAEAAFVEKLAADFGLPCRTGHGDVRQIKRQASVSIQEAARLLRYQFLEQIFRETRASHIATGHTADDQAEEVLLRLIRGSALPGLSGIPWTRDGHIIRPLLGISRAEIMQHVETRGLPFVTDSSNQSPAYLRNRVRMELLPFLERSFNPAIRRTLTRTASVLADDQAFLEGLASGLFIELIKTLPHGQGLAFPVSKVRAQPAALRRRLYRQALYALDAPVRRLTADHLLSIDALLNSNRPNAIRHLPDGPVVERRGDLLLFRCHSQEAREPSRETVTVKGPGIWLAPGSNGEVHISLREPPSDPCSSASAPPPRVLWMDASKLQPPLVLRTRRPGDRFWPFGTNTPLRLKGFLMARGVPREERDIFPLLVSGEEIVAVLDLEIAHPYRLQANSRQALALQWIRPKWLLRTAPQTV